MSKLALWLRNANKIHRHLETYVTPVRNDHAGRRRCVCKNRFKATYAHILSSMTVNRDQSPRFQDRRGDRVPSWSPVGTQVAW